MKRLRFELTVKQYSEHEMDRKRTEIKGLTDAINTFRSTDFLNKRERSGHRSQRDIKDGESALLWSPPKLLLSMLSIEM